MGINTESLTEQLVSLILDMIMRKELKAGEQIPTKKIAEAHGVSVMPVRLALRELAERRLVVTKARVGYYVAEYSLSELIDISNCRKMFELYCLENFFDSLDLDRLRHLNQSIEENFAGNFDEVRYQKDDILLHESFVLASHNDFIITQYSQVKDLISLFVIYDSDNMENNYLSRAEHLRLLNYIFSKKKEAAVLELKTHLDRSERTLLELTKNH